MGFSIFGAAAATFLIAIKGHRSILGGSDSEAVKAAWMNSGSNTLAVPEKAFEDDDDEARA